MRIRRDSSFGLNLDSLLDTMTNVVGILIVLLVVVHVGASSAVKRIGHTANSSPVSTNELADARAAAIRAKARVASTQGRWHAIESGSRKTENQEDSLQRLGNELDELAALAPRMTDKTAPSVKELTQRRGELAKELSRLQGELGAVQRPPPIVVRAPVERNETKQKPRFFLISGDRVACVDAVRDVFNNQVNEINTLIQNQKVRSNEDAWKQFMSRTRSRLQREKEFRIQFVTGKPDVSDSYIEVTLRDGMGMTQTQLTEGDSSFQSLLRSLRGDNQAIVVFLVRTGSFSSGVYAAARSIVDGQNIPATWLPLDREFRLSPFKGGGGGAGIRPD